MANITDLSDLSQTQVDQALALITTMTKERHPELALEFGGLYSLLLLPAAEHAAANQANIDNYLLSSTPYQIASSPDTADQALVDAAMSNRGITRNPGTAATGRINVIISKRLPLTVASGTVFVGGGQQFVTTTAYGIKTATENIDSATDQVLVPLADGSYQFTLSVTASAVGSAGMLRKGTLLTTDEIINNLVKIYAAEDFIGGVNEETNSQLLLREAEGAAAKTLSNRINCSAFLRSSEYSSFVASSIIGAGDAEMQRDKHTIFPGSFGGRTDWYLRTARNVTITTLEKTCVLVEKTGDGYGIWQFDLGRDEAPGFYEISSVAPASDAEFAGSYQLVSDIRGFDSSGIPGELLPDIDNPIEATFSRFQTTVVRFKDTDTLTEALTVTESTAKYKVGVRVLPDIAGIQSLLSSRANRSLFGDVLVKAPVPCFVSLGFTLLGQPGALLPDVTAMKAALVDYINDVPFTGHLFASDLTRIVHGFLTSGVSVSAIDMLGRILKPNGDITSLRSTELLIIPDDPGNMVSARTVGFVTYADLVRISASVLNTPEIL